MHTLTAYQTEIARAVLDSVLRERGLTFTLEIAAGGGAREISSQLEMLLLGLHVNEGIGLLKVTREPAEATARLTQHLRESALQGLWSTATGVVRLGRSHIRFASPLALDSQQIELPLVPMVHSLGPMGLVEVAQAQLMDRETGEGWLLPLTERSGVTTVLYGTPWAGESWFEDIAKRNRELEASDGLRRHFQVTWQQARRELPDLPKPPSRKHNDVPATALAS